jgi:hypothetical protein
VSRLDGRLDVRKTYKLYIGGAFPRSESGRSYEVRAADGRFLANAALASRKDARDAVAAALAAQPKWAVATAYNRGQILYRVAEMLEGRRDQFAAEVGAPRGSRASRRRASSTPRSTAGSGTPAGATRSRRSGNANPVAGPYFNLPCRSRPASSPSLAPQRPRCSGWCPSSRR